MLYKSNTYLVWCCMLITCVEFCKSKEGVLKLHPTFKDMNELGSLS